MKIQNEYKTIDLQDLVTERMHVGRDVVHSHYDCLEDIRSELIGNSYAAHTFERYLVESSRDSEWWGVRNGIKGVQDIIDNGWREGADKVEALVEQIACSIPRVRGVRRRKARAAFGDELDIHRVYTGGLDTAWDTTIREQHTNIGMNNTTVLIEVKTPSMIDAYKALWRGVAATALVKALAESGRNVEVMISNVAQGLFTGKTHIDPLAIVTCQVKEFNMPLDIENIAAASSVGVYRYLMFKAKASFGRRIASGFGRNVLTCPNVASPFTQGHTHKIVYVPYDIYSKDAAVRFLENVVQTQFS